MWWCSYFNILEHLHEVQYALLRKEVSLHMLKHVLAQRWFYKQDQSTKAVVSCRAQIDTARILFYILCRVMV